MALWSPDDRFQDIVNEITSITLALSQIQLKAENSQDRMISLRGQVEKLRRETVTTAESREAMRKLEAIREMLHEPHRESAGKNKENKGKQSGLSSLHSPKENHDADSASRRVHEGTPGRKSMAIEEPIGDTRKDVEDKTEGNLSRHSEMDNASNWSNGNPAKVKGKSKAKGSSCQVVSETSKRSSRSNSSSLNYPLHPQPPDISERNKWVLNYSKPLASARRPLGPLRWNELRRAGLDTDMMFSLESLALMPDHGLRLQIYDDMAFVYDPIILQWPSSAFLINWGIKMANRRVGKYIANAGRADGKVVFHTFLFPVKKDAWYYVGAYEWKIQHLWAVWPTLGCASKRTLVSKLRERSGQEHVEIMMDSGELEQFSVEISGDAYGVLSKEFEGELLERIRSQSPLVDDHE